MNKAYRNGQDLYATVASKIYHNCYWDNMEHHEDGTPNPDGAKRRSNTKSVVLGLMYGRQAASIAEQTGQTYEEAQQVINDFYNGFPKVRDWVVKSEADAKERGYVEDFWGRRRRLPDIQLPKYTIKLKKADASHNFNPILGTKGIIKNVEDTKITKYKQQLERCRNYKDANTIKIAAEKDGVIITDNGAFIAQAERQCVNSRVQGAAATMTKIALRKIYDDKILRDLGFHILITVHDEIIGECPAENAEEVSERLSYVMAHSVEPEIKIPFKCDPEIESCWYINNYQHDLMREIHSLIAKYGKEEGIRLFSSSHTECTPEELQENIDLYFNENN